MGGMTDSPDFRLRRNLADAGCDAAFIRRFLELEEGQRRKEQYRLLSRHRAALLEELHQEQYKIDCLDYLVYTMQREDAQKNGGF